MPRTAKPIWILVPCASEREAVRIGTTLLRARLAACIKVLEIEHERYFWPPKSGKMVRSEDSALLIVETFASRERTVRRRVAALHSYELPLIATIPLRGVSAAFRRWMVGEIR